MKSPLAVSLALTGSLALLFFAMEHNKHEDRARGCRSHLRMLALCIAQYRQDFDTRFPPIAISRRATGTAWMETRGIARTRYQGEAYGWADALFHSGASLSLFICPDSSWQAISQNSRQAPFTAYWMNWNLSGAKSSSVRYPAQTFLLGDGTDAPELGNRSDATFHLSALPPSWLNGSDSPLLRHLGGANYLFTDGHAKWLRPDEAKNFGERADPFSIR